MKTETISIIQTILGIILTILIILQAKGTGVGTAFGGEIGFYRTKRGVEKMLFIASIIISTLFLLSALAGLLLP